MIIYPPFIGETIPAFVKTKIIIPFEDNPAVPSELVSGYQLQIKSYQSGIVKGVLKSTTVKDNRVEFEIEKDSEIYNSLIVGTYYKFQLMYLDSSTNGTYSSAALGKCIGEDASKFSLKIRYLKGEVKKEGDKKEGTVTGTDLDEKANYDQTLYYGEYINGSDFSEPTYSYRFILTQGDTVIDDTGPQLYMADTANPTYYTRHLLEDGKEYALQLKVTTINGYELETPKYPIITGSKIVPDFNGKIVAEEQDAEAIENGYIKIHLAAVDPSIPLSSGEFLIERKATDENIFTEIEQFTLSVGEDWKDLEWIDTSIEQGKDYVYYITQIYDIYKVVLIDTEVPENSEEYENQYKKLQEANDYLVYHRYSERVPSNQVTAEFIHTFLSDGERQLKIKYNPKVSTFKNTLLEQKQDTIGGTYPFFFRNGTVKYKEIPISGLISYHLDDNEFFTSKEELGLNNLDTNRIRTMDKGTSLANQPTTSLVDYNITAERLFKLLVLEWLNNGKPKFFRSPTEGNYIVRLMNVSLSPQDTLGRMLHTFTATGYECLPNTLDSLKENSLVNFKPPKKEEDLVWYGPVSIKTNEEKVKNIQYFKNIKWNCLSPIGETEYIEIDEQKIINNKTGTYQTPEGEIYTSLNIVGNKSIVTYEYTLQDTSSIVTYSRDTINAFSGNLFEKLLVTYYREEDSDFQAIFTEGKIDEKTITQIFSIQVNKKSKDSEYCKIKINNEQIIDIGDLGYTWNNPQGIQSLSYQSGVAVTIYYERRTDM